MFKLQTELTKANTKTYRQIYYELRKDEIAESQRKYYLKNRDKILARAKERYEENKEIFSERNHLYKLTHADKVAEKNRRYYQKNKERLREKQRLKRIMDRHEKFNSIMRDLRKILSEINDEEYFRAAIQISCDKWLDSKGYNNHRKTLVMREILRGFELQEEDNK